MKQSDKKKQFQLISLQLFAFTQSSFGRTFSETDLLTLNTDNACEKFNFYCSKSKSSPSVDPTWTQNLNSTAIRMLSTDIKFCGSSVFNGRVDVVEAAKIVVNNACEVLGSRCKHNDLGFIEGNCDDLSKCQKKRGYHTLRYKSDPDSLSRRSIFIPNCDDSTGDFAPLQCHDLIGYCWCVNPDNIKIKGTVTSLKGDGAKKPNCENAKNSNKRMKRSECSKTSSKWIEFKTHLIKDIVYEYRATQQLLKLLETGNGKAKRWAKRSSLFAPYHPMPVSPEPDTVQWKEAVDWKFKELDKDNDGKLKRSELRLFIQQMSKWSGSGDYSCPNAFKDNCKIHVEFKKLNKIEWKNCLSDSRHILESLAIDQTHNRGYTPKPQTEKAKYDRLPSRRKPHQDDRSSKTATPEISCLEEQKASKRLFDVSDSENVIVPDCTTDGQFKVIQCHRKSKYCWCVHPLTGRAITETSTRNGKPTSCTLNNGNRHGLYSHYQEAGRYGGYGYNTMRYGNAMKNNQILNEMKVGVSWRGCSNGDRFIRKFNKVIGDNLKAKNKRKKSKRDSKKRKNGKSKLNKSHRSNRRGYKKIRRNFFKSMDKNKNGILETKEQKNIRRMVRSSQPKGTKKCLRKFFDVHCDKNRDGVVDVSEFAKCTYFSSKRKRASIYNSDIVKDSWHTLQKRSSI